MIMLRSVCTEYCKENALKEVSLTADNGKVTVLLGNAGSGKSAVCDIVCGLISATSGSVTVDGCDVEKDPIEAKRRIAYMPQDPAVFRDMTVRGQLKFIGQAREMSARALSEQIEKVIKKTGLADVANMSIRQLPEAYLQRVGIAQALMGDVDNIVIDAPTKPLDAKQRLEIREIIKNVCGDKTVLLATDNLTEAAALGGRVYVIDNGTIIGCVESADIADLSESATDTVVRIAAEPAKAEAAVKASGLAYTALEERDGAAYFQVTTGIGLAGKIALSAAVAKEGLAIVDMRPAKCDLSKLVLRMENEPFVSEGADA